MSHLWPAMWFLNTNRLIGYLSRKPGHPITINERIMPKPQTLMNWYQKGKNKMKKALCSVTEWWLTYRWRDRQQTASRRIATSNTPDQWTVNVLWLTISLSADVVKGKYELSQQWNNQAIYLDGKVLWKHFNNRYIKKDNQSLKEENTGYVDAFYGRTRLDAQYVSPVGGDVYSDERIMSKAKKHRNYLKVVHNWTIPPLCHQHCISEKGQGLRDGKSVRHGPIMCWRHGLW